jgi:hypothetical protein
LNETLAARAEILKLARLLSRDPTSLEYLEQVPADDIRSLREQVTELLFTAHGHALGRLATASRLLPVGVVATIGERAFGPVLSARITGMLEPARAVEMAARLPVAFLADVAIDLDPRRASEVIARIPPRQIGEITAELLRREEYVTMGRFVGHLPPEAVSAALEVMDDQALLRVAFVLESKSTLDELVGLLAPGRLDGIIDVAASANLWPETLDLLAHLSDEQRAALASNVAARDDGVLDSLLAAADQDGLWDELLPLVPFLSADERARVERAASGRTGPDQGPRTREDVAPSGT